MNTNQFSFDDDLTAALSETNAHQANPRPEHIEQLRAKLLARTLAGTAELASFGVPLFKGTRRLIRIGLPVAACIAIAAALVPIWWGPSNALADLLEATRTQKWIHGTTTWIGGEETVQSESWMSPPLQIFAIRHPEMIMFVDHKKQVSARFKPGSDSITLVRPTPIDYLPQQQSSSTLEQLLTNPEAEQPFFGFEVLGMKKTETKVDRKRAWEYSFRLEQPGNPNNSRRVRAVIDAHTDLVATWEERHSNGLRVVTKFDYPPDGPHDLYALGIPKNAKVVDRLAATDVTHIASQLREGRTNFDNYDAIVLQHVEGRQFLVTDSLSVSIRRVRRSGRKYRLDYLLRAKPGVKEPAADADMDEWWKKNRDQFWSVPMLICDGRTITTYSMVDDVMPREGKPNLEVELRMAHPVNGFRDDPTVSWPHLMPAFSVRPHIWTTDEKRTFEFEPTPEDGPDGTVRLIVNRPGDLLTPELHRYWLAPDRDFCLRRAVQPVQGRDKKSIEYIDTEEFEAFQKSPKGHWYSTRSRRTTSNTDVVQVRDYYVDFESELDVSLFGPLELGE